MAVGSIFAVTTIVILETTTTWTVPRRQTSAVYDEAVKRTIFTSTSPALPHGPTSASAPTRPAHHSEPLPPALPRRSDTLVDGSYSGSGTSLSTAASPDLVLVGVVWQWRPRVSLTLLPTIGAHARGYSTPLDGSLSQSLSSSPSSIMGRPPIVVSSFDAWVATDAGLGSRSAATQRRPPNYCSIADIVSSIGGTLWTS